jgi:hypothetical protein
VEEPSVTPISFAKFPIVYGMVLFAFDINGIVSEIRMEMEKPHRFINVLAKSMGIEVCCYSIIGITGVKFTLIFRLSGLWKFD